MNRMFLLAALLSLPVNPNCGNDPPARANVTRPSMNSDCTCSIRVFQGHDKETPQELVGVMRATNTANNAHLRFAVYALTYPPFIDEIIAAKKRGVNVRGLVDKSQTGGAHMMAQVQRLQDAGVPVKWGDSNGKMHLKMLVTEAAYVSGSFNWSMSAQTVNDEVVEVGRNCESVRSQYEKIWEEVYARNNFVDLNVLLAERKQREKRKSKK